MKESRIVDEKFRIFSKICTRAKDLIYGFVKIQRVGYGQRLRKTGDHTIHCLIQSCAPVFLLQIYNLHQIKNNVHDQIYEPPRPHWPN